MLAGAKTTTKTTTIKVKIILKIIMYKLRPYIPPIRRGT